MREKQDGLTSLRITGLSQPTVYRPWGLSAVAAATLRNTVVVPLQRRVQLIARRRQPRPINCGILLAIGPQRDGRPDRLHMLHLLKEENPTSLRRSGWLPAPAPSRSSGPGRRTRCCHCTSSGAMHRLTCSLCLMDTASSAEMCVSPLHPPPTDPLQLLLVDALQLLLVLRGWVGRFRCF